eukprot:6247291-Amphidinium_carterae.2
MGPKLDECQLRTTSHMNDVRISARKTLGKGTSLRRSSPFELMAYGTSYVYGRNAWTLASLTGPWRIGYGIPP